MYGKGFHSTLPINYWNLHDGLQGRLIFLLYRRATYTEHNYVKNLFLLRRI